MARYMIRKLSPTSRLPHQWLAGLKTAQLHAVRSLTWADNADYALTFATYNLASQSLENIAFVCPGERFDIVTIKTVEEFYA